MFLNKILILCLVAVVVKRRSVSFPVTIVSLEKKWGSWVGVTHRSTGIKLRMSLLWLLCWPEWAHTGGPARTSTFPSFSHLYFSFRLPFSSWLLLFQIHKKVTLFHDKVFFSSVAFLKSKALLCCSHCVRLLGLRYPPSATWVADKHSTPCPAFSILCFFKSHQKTFKCIGRILLLTQNIMLYCKEYLSFLFKEKKYKNGRNNSQFQK